MACALLARQRRDIQQQYIGFPLHHLFAMCFMIVIMLYTYESVMSSETTRLNSITTRESCWNHSLQSARGRTAYESTATAGLEAKP